MKQWTVTQVRTWCNKHHVHFSQEGDTFLCSQDFKFENQHYLLNWFKYWHHFRLYTLDEDYQK